MRHKSDAKFKEKLTFGFKYDMKNLMNFHPTIQKSLKISLQGALIVQSILRFELKKYRGIIFHDTEQ